ncbi:rho guanine nucleotide exchange factor 6-like [Mercenaria mercenaria]|uniref:rho guanine nucleotide exchange factor 6-like n=1 Tax=Mercenaria mercenaria TaxID=6596 RepID=UPI00234F7A6D|nr:rho guanine nucleotide exchange factor 6-like [Mercenaria mercenaria]
MFDTIYHRKIPLKKIDERLQNPQADNKQSKPWTGSLVDTVYSLRDQVKALEMDQKKMKKDLEDETKARKSLENLIKKFMKNQQSMNLVNKDKEMEENHT